MKKTLKGIQSKYGIEMRLTKSKKKEFKCFTGVLHKHRFHVQEWNLCPFAPLPDHFVLTVYNPKGEEIFHNKELRIKSLELGISICRAIIKQNRNML